MYADEEESPRIKGTFEIYRAEADLLFKQGEYKKAIGSYTTALELRKDMNCLVARSKCHLHLGDTQNALEDAETSLLGDDTFHKGIYQKAQSLYYRGDFELALVFYHRGHRLRPELPEFRLGIQRAQEGIDNAVGAPERVKLSTKGDLSYFDRLQQTKRKPTLASFTDTAKQQEQKQQERKCVSSEKTVKQLLGELYGDKQYLEKLLKVPGPSSNNGKPVKAMAQDGLVYLNSRTEFWRQQNPLYARKQDRVLLRRPINMSAGDFVVREIEILDKDLTDGRYSEVIKRSQNCIAVVETFSASELSKKFEVIANLHSFLGNAYLEMMCYTKAIRHHRLDHELGKKYKITAAVSRSLDNIGRAHARNKEYAKAIEVWEQKLPLSRSTIESTWLYHEIGRCYLECGEFSKAQEFGEMAIKTSGEINDAMWQLQAHVLVAQAHMKQNNFDAAIASFTESLSYAKSQGDESAEVALVRAIEELSIKAKGETEPAAQVEEDGSV